MDIISSLAVVAFAALIHASFQLSVSMLSLMSGHTIGTKRSHAKLMRLITGFLGGAAVMTTLLVAFACLVLLVVLQTEALRFMWVLGCGLLFGIGVAVWLFYYRRHKGTTLWIPRGIATYLAERTKATTRSAEAFGLGLTSVIGESLFIIAPIFVSALTIVQLPGAWQLAAIGLYTIISLLSLLVVSALVGSGHKLSSIQRWREQNKHFLQFSAGGGLLILGFYLYVHQIMATAALGMTTL